VADLERVATGHQDRGRGPGDRRLLDVEPLEEVECAQEHHQQDRRLPGSPPLLEQVRGHQHQRGAGGKRECMEQPHCLHRLEVEQQMSSPADARRQGRGDVDQTDQRGGQGDQPWQPA
jgi:hypothetical protein